MTRSTTKEAIRFVAEGYSANDIALELIVEAARYRKEGKMGFSQAETLKRMAKGSTTPNNANYFITFSDVPKLGINPQSEYSTPLGIYAYPLTEKVAKALTEGHKEAPHISLFATDRRYIVAAKLKDPSSILYISKYSAEDLKKDIQKLKTMPLSIKEKEQFPSTENLKEFEQKLKRWQTEILQKIKESPMAPVASNEASVIANLWNIIQYYSRPHEDDYDNYDFLEFPNIGVAITKFIEAASNATIYKNIKKSSVLSFTKAILKDLHPHTQVIRVSRDSIDQVIEKGIRTSKGKKPGTQIWNITRLLANERPVKWAALLRKLGYEGAVDDGIGTIHSNEPTQAAFFSVKPLKFAGVFDNISQDLGAKSGYPSLDAQDAIQDRIDQLKIKLSGIHTPASSILERLKAFEMHLQHLWMYRRVSRNQAQELIPHLKVIRKWILHHYARGKKSIGMNPFSYLDSLENDLNVFIKSFGDKELLDPNDSSIKTIWSELFVKLYKALEDLKFGFAKLYEKEKAEAKILSPEEIEAKIEAIRKKTRIKIPDTEVKPMWKSKDVKVALPKLKKSKDSWIIGFDPTDPPPKGKK